MIDFTGLSAAQRAKALCDFVNGDAFAAVAAQLSAFETAGFPAGDATVPLQSANQVHAILVKAAARQSDVLNPPVPPAPVPMPDAEV